MFGDSEQLRLHVLMLSQPVAESLALLETLSEQYPWLQGGVKELTVTPLSQWQGEFTRLFISGYPKTVAPPFESAYRYQTMFGPVVEDLTALYRCAGLTTTEQMPADYLGVELECAAYLAESIQPDKDKLLLQLWHDHLLQWLPAFATDLQQKSHLQIYRLLGEQLSELCNTGRVRDYA